MTARRFVDTNVLLYALVAEPTEAWKMDRAERILEQDDLGLSVQVLQEFYTQATRAGRPNRIGHERAVDLIHEFCFFRVQDMTLEVLLAAIATCERYRISYWDAAIIEAARALGCDTVLSEDLSDGQDYGGVRVVNPFA